MSDKTEAPTPRRLRRAREDGDVAVSGALTQAVALLAVIPLVPAALAATASHSAERVRAAIGGSGADSATWAAWDVLSLSAPLVLAGAVAALTAGWLQSNGVIATGKLAPDLGRLDPVRGLAQLVSLPRIFALLRAVLGAIVVAWLAGQLLVSEAPSITGALGSPEVGAALAGHLGRRLVWTAALIGLGLAIVDYAVVRHAWWRRLRMSKAEVKRDHRESEGDPELKAARRRAHEELLNQSVVAAVRDATVVVINPTHLATALRYAEESDAAPQVLAQGRGEFARQVVEAARAYGVPVIQDVPVAHALADLELGEEIPEALYEAVAEILRAAWAERPPAGTAADVSPATGGAASPRIRA